MTRFEKINKVNNSVIFVYGLFVSENRYTNFAITEIKGSLYTQICAL